LDNSNYNKILGVLYYIYLVTSVPKEALLRLQFRSRRIEEYLWNLKHRSHGEIFVACANRIKKTRELRKVYVKYHFNSILTYIPLSTSVLLSYTFLIYIYSNFFCHICAICSIHFIRAFGKQKESWNFPLSNFLHFLSDLLCLISLNYCPVLYSCLLILQSLP